MNIQNRLKDLRKKRNYTMKTVATALGISLSAYQKYENGTRDLSTETLCKLADFYGTTTDYLLSRDTDEPDPLDALVGQFNMSLLEKKIVEGYLDLPEDMREDLMQFLDKTIKEVKEESK